VAPRVQETRNAEAGAGRMSSHASSWLAWSLAALCVAMFLALVALFVLTRSARNPSSLGTRLTLIDLLVGVPFLAFPLVGALIASRRPHNPIGWICLAVGLLFMLLGVTDFYSRYGVASPGSVPFPVAIYSLSEWLWVPTVGLLGTYLLLLFPDGRLPSRRWRPLAWLSGVVIVLLSAAIFLDPGPLQGLKGGVRNPFGLEEHPWVEDVFIIVFPLLTLCILASALSLVLRYRRYRGEERQQIKWIAFAASLLAFLFMVGVGASLLAAGTTGGAEPLWLKVLQNAAAVSYVGVPVAVGFAVLRYRLYDIDVVINRTLVYGSLTAILVLLYVGEVVSLQYAFRALTGQESQLAIVASTLVIAALFNPLRKRVQAFVDRRFYRRKYDAAKTLEAFSAKLRDETDLDALNADLVGVVRETMQPAHVSLWLREPPETGAER